MIRLFFEKLKLTKMEHGNQILFLVKLLKNGSSILERSCLQLLLSAVHKNRGQILGGSLPSLQRRQAIFYKQVTVLEQKHF